MISRRKRRRGDRKQNLLMFRGGLWEPGRLRALAALSEHLGLASSTRWWFTTACNSSSKGSYALLCLLIHKNFTHTHNIETLTERGRERRERERKGRRKDCSTKLWK